MKRKIAAAVLVFLMTVSMFAMPNLSARAGDEEPVVTITDFVYPTEVDWNNILPHGTITDFTSRGDVNVSNEISYDVYYESPSGTYGGGNGKRYAVVDWPKKYKMYAVVFTIYCDIEQETIPISVNGETYTAELHGFEGYWLSGEGWYVYTSAVTLGTLDVDGKFHLTVNEDPILTMPNLEIPTQITNTEENLPNSETVDTAAYTWREDVTGTELSIEWCYEDTENGSISIDGKKYTPVQDQKPVVWKKYAYLLTINCDQAVMTANVTINGKTYKVTNFGHVDETTYTLHGIVPIGVLNEGNNFTDEISGPVVTITDFEFPTKLDMNGGSLPRGTVTNWTHRADVNIYNDKIQYNTYTEGSLVEVDTCPGGNGKYYSQASEASTEYAYAIVFTFTSDLNKKNLPVRINGNDYTADRYEENIFASDEEITRYYYTVAVRIGTPDEEGNLTVNYNGPVAELIDFEIPTSMDMGQDLPEPWFITDYSEREDVNVNEVSFGWCYEASEGGTVLNGKHYVKADGQKPEAGKKYAYLYYVACDLEEETAEVNINGKRYRATYLDDDQGYRRFYGVIELGIPDEEGSLVYSDDSVTLKNFEIPTKVPEKSELVDGWCVKTEFVTDYIAHSDINIRSIWYSLGYEDPDGSATAHNGKKYKNNSSEVIPEADSYALIFTFECVQKLPELKININGKTFSAPRNTDRDFMACFGYYFYDLVVVLGSPDEDGNLSGGDFDVMKGWAKEKGKWYYYEEGSKVTGKQTLAWNNKQLTYFFNDNGAMKRNEWTELRERFYFAGRYGDALTAKGWKKMSGKWYYFKLDNESNASYTESGLFTDKNGKVYYLDPDDHGAMLTGWQNVNGTETYFDKYGARANGWVKIDGKWHYIKNGTDEKKSCWFKDGGNWYYFDENGEMVTNKVVDGWKLNKYGVGKKVK